MPLEVTRAIAPWVVFTDLDGSLLDARTYAVGPAREALALLAGHGVPVVFCSSKTASEQRSLRLELGLVHPPFIVENGAAVLVPASADLPVTDWPTAGHGLGERVRTLGRPATEVRAGIARAAAAAQLHVTGFADLSIRQVAELTGLDEPAAERAREREYSETLIDDFPPEAWLTLEKCLAAEGLCCRHGGRFRTVTGVEADKGIAVRVVAELCAAAAHQPVITVGLGDSANDEGMLRAVDRPYLLAKDDGTWAAIDIPNLRRLAKPGPRGWRDAILNLLADAAKSPPSIHSSPTRTMLPGPG